MALRSTLVSVAVVVAAIEAKTTVVSSVDASWKGFGIDTVWTDAQCTDLVNLVNTTAAGCQAVCETTPRCNAINAHVPTGPCALRSCPCEPGLSPGGNLSGFEAFLNVNAACPPTPLFANVFGSGMVLQRAPMQPRVFGLAPPNATLLITVLQTTALRSTEHSGTVRPPPAETPPTTTIVNAAGEWSCLLPAFPAGGPFNLTATVVQSADRGGAPALATPHQQTISDVLFGDVFVCGGQSNMELPVALVNNASAELAASTAFPWIRLAVVGRSSSATPLRDTSAPLLLPWQKASPEALGDGQSWDYFSATCWFTAREVARTLGPTVPLGLIGSYVGGVRCTIVCGALALGAVPIACLTLCVLMSNVWCNIADSD